MIKEHTLYDFNTVRLWNFWNLFYVHYSILAWEIPWTEEPCGLQSMGSQKSWTQLSNLITMCIFHHETILMHLLIKLRQSRRETLYVSVIFLVYEICLEKNILLVCFLPFSKYSQKSDFFSCCKPILPPLFYWRNWVTNMKWFTPNWLASG